MKQLEDQKGPKERYSPLGHNSLSLEDGTDAERTIFKKIEDAFRQEQDLEQSLQDTRFSLYILAASLRRKYCSKDTGKYDPAFREWFFERRKLNTRFGSLSNFTKYALAGELITFIVSAQENPSEYLVKLPSRMSVLYALHGVKEELYARKKDEHVFFKLFFHRAERASVTSEPKIDGPQFIRPELTEHEIKEWLDAWKPKQKALSEKAQRKTFSVPVATIFAHKSLFDFDKKSGDHIGKLSIDELDRLVRSLEGLLASKAKSKLLLQSSFAKIESKYRKRAERFDPARKIIKPPKGKTAKASPRG